MLEEDAKGVTEAILLTESSGAIDITFGSSYVYDSNIFLLPNGPGASIGVFDLEANYISSSQSARGGYYGIGYKGQAFLYESSEAKAGRTPYEHYVDAFVGVNGSRTHFNVSGNYHDNNGNSLLGTGNNTTSISSNEIDSGKINREVRLAVSQDFDASASLIRDLPHGSLEARFSYSSREFDSSALNSGTNYALDTAWFHQPGYAPKTEIGVGFKIGRDEYDNNSDQDYYTPSLRARYRLSGKTSFFGDVGYEFREGQGTNANDVGNTVYSYGVAWAATERTTLDLGGYRNVRPSYIANGADYDATGVRLRWNQQLPREFNFSTSAGYENAGYFSSSTGASFNREDDFFVFQAVLDHDLNLSDMLDGKISLFYNYNDNDSTAAISTYEQHIAGFRFSVTY